MRTSFSDVGSHRDGVKFMDEFLGHFHQVLLSRTIPGILLGRNRGRWQPGLVCHCVRMCVYVRHGKSWFLSANQFSGLKNVRKFTQFLIIKKWPKFTFFQYIGYFWRKLDQMLVSNADLWQFMGKNCQNFVVYTKMSTIFAKIVRKQCLHACNFFRVWCTYVCACVCVYVWDFFSFSVCVCIYVCVYVCLCVYYIWWDFRTKYSPILGWANC